MYNNISDSNNIFSTSNLHFEPSRCSVLDTIGTFRQIFDISTPNVRHKKDFYTLYYRRKNLLLKSKLEKSSLYNEPTIQKTCKALACCSSHSELKTYSNTETHVTRTSQKCKSRYCLICSRIESNKNTMKFIDVATTSMHHNFFHNKHFYFLTLTVKHNEETRNFNYLPDFRKNVNQLQRSKIFRDTFIQSKDKNNYGSISSIEMTMSQNQYHIHSHILICCNPIKNRIAEVEKKIKDKWLNITKDSDQIRLDLIKNIPDQNQNNELHESSNELIKSVSEVFKYVVKSESLSKLNGDQIDLMAQWIIDTKGKNFINCLGYFRKLGLVRRIKKGDQDTVIKTDATEQKAYLTKTISIETNANLNLNYSKGARNQVLKYFKIIAIADAHIDVTTIKDDLGDIFKMSSGRELTDTFLFHAAAEIEKNNRIADEILNTDYFSDHFNKNASKSMNKEFPEAPF